MKARATKAIPRTVDIYCFGPMGNNSRLNVPRLQCLAKLFASDMEPTKDLTLEGLTARILESSTTISECIDQNRLPKLSFDSDAPAQFPVPPTFPAVHMARLALLEATTLLERLVQGPIDYVLLTSAHVRKSTHI